MVDFDPAQGAEIQKIRPALILQNDIGNRFSPITIIAAITVYGGEQLYPTEIVVRSSEGGMEKDSVILLNQVRSIDKTRLVRRLGVVREETMMLVERATEISLGLIGS